MELQSILNSHISIRNENIRDFGAGKKYITVQS